MRGELPAAPSSTPPGPSATRRRAVDALQEEIGRGLAHPLQPGVAQKRRAQVSGESGLEQKRRDVDQDHLQGGPVEIEIRAEQPFTGEALQLRAGEHEQALEEVEPGLIRLEERSTDVGEDVRVRPDELRDPRAELERDRPWWTAADRGPEGLEGALNDELVDGSPEPRLRAEMVLDEPRRDARGPGDVADRGRCDTAGGEVPPPRVSDARGRGRIRLPSGDDGRCHTVVLYTIRSYGSQRSDVRLGRAAARRRQWPRLRDPHVG